MKKKSVKVRRESFSLRQHYIECFDFLNSIKKQFYIVLFVFCFFMFAGLFLPIPQEVSQQLLDYFKELIKETEGFGVFGMTWYLFQNNIVASFFGYIFGALFGIFPLFNAMANGFVLGFASRLSIAENGIFSLWRLFPHGIFEIPALFISLTMGLKLGVSVIEFRNGKFKDVFRKSFKTFFMVVFPLIVVAAVVEGMLIVFS